MCDPSAVPRFVITVIVDAIQLLSLRGFSHISQKVFKFLPALADSNSPCTVILIDGRFWIGASLDHVIPAAIDRSLTSAFGMQVCFRHYRFASRREMFSVIQSCSPFRASNSSAVVIVGKSRIVVLGSESQSSHIAENLSGGISTPNLSG